MIDIHYNYGTGVRDTTDQRLAWSTKITLVAWEASRVSYVYNQSINLSFDIGTHNHDDINMMISTHINVA